MSAVEHKVAGLRVVVADDSVLLREGIARLLTEAGVDVLAGAADGDDLMRKVRAHKPDAAVIDVRMPPTHTNEGLTAALEIRAELPEIALLILSQHAETGFARTIITGNAAGFGYLLKDRVINVEAFLDALHRVSMGGTVMDPEIVERMLGKLESGSAVERLTERERDVVKLMAEGRSNNAIAANLNITRRAAEKHVSRIFEKFDLHADHDDHRRVLAVIKYLEQNSMAP